MTTAHRIRFITQNFSAMQGLRFAPFAAWLLFTGMAYVLNLDWSWELLVPLPFCIAAFYWAHRYYQTRYGEVVPKQDTRQAAKEVVLSLSIIALVLIEFSLRLPISIVCLLLAAYGVYRYIQTGRIFSYYFFLTAVALLAAFAPLFVTVPERDSLFNLQLGAIWLTASLLDHLTLTRFLKPALEE